MNKEQNLLVTFYYKILNIIFWLISNIRRRFGRTSSLFEKWWWGQRI